MPYYVFLSNRTTFETVLMVVGGIVPACALFFGIYSLWKRRTDKKREQELESGLSLSGKFSTIHTAVGRLETSTNLTREQYQQFRKQVEDVLVTLKKQVAELQAQHIIYQHATDVSDLEKKIERLILRVDRVADDLTKHRELVNERFMTIESYKSDLLMWTNAFDSIRQDVRAITLSIKRGQS